MNRSIFVRAGLGLLFVLAAQNLMVQTVANNVFDVNSGLILASSFSPNPAANWVNTFFGLSKNSGNEFFESDNGNFNGNFENLVYVKDIGGTILDAEYEVSFYIAANNLNNENMQAVEFSDFDSLAIGGAGGTMSWHSTPTPTPSGSWMRWTGTYIPSPADIGTQFAFRMVVDIDSRHSLALDGPMTATLLRVFPSRRLVSCCSS